MYIDYRIVYWTVNVVLIQILRTYLCHGQMWRHDIIMTSWVWRQDVYVTSLVSRSAFRGGFTRFMQDRHSTHAMLAQWRADAGKHRPMIGPNMAQSITSCCCGEDPEESVYCFHSVFCTTPPAKKEVNTENSCLSGSLLFIETLLACTNSV